jgi:hypothetical protein
MPVPVSQCRLPAIAIATSFRGFGTSNRAKRMGKVLNLLTRRRRRAGRPLFLGGWTAKARHAATSIPFNDDDEPARLQLVGRQWCSSMIRIIRGIGIPRSHKRMGMVSLLSCVMCTLGLVAMRRPGFAAPSAVTKATAFHSGKSC